MNQEYSAIDRPVRSVAGIVLAGGRSRRMGGINKALLEIDGIPIIRRIVSTLERVFRHIIIITNSPQEYRFLDVPLFRDIRTGYGSLGGLYTGLSNCPVPHGFFVACDMPFLNEHIMRMMVESMDNFDVVIPRIRGLLEPLHAIYGRSCIPHLEDLMDRNDLKILNLFPHVSVKEIPETPIAQIDPELRFAINVNTPEDLARASD